MAKNKSEIKKFLKEGFKEDVMGLYTRLRISLVKAKSDSSKKNAARTRFKNGLNHMVNALNEANEIVDSEVS